MLLELAQEHAWRLLLNWPEQVGAPLGIAPDMASLLMLAKVPAHWRGWRNSRCLPPGSGNAVAALPGRLLADLPDAGPALVRAWSLGENKGLAGVETSRGLLLHVVRLQAGKVAEYRIVAPTEWNFHPASALAQALSGLAPGDDLAAHARLVAQSLDPCVAFGIEVCDA